MAGTLQFRSGFEAETTVSEYSRNGKRHMHRITGEDAETGYDWDDLPCAEAYFVYIIGDEAPNDYVTTDIQTVEGIDGKPTQALHMSVKGDYAPGKSTSRNEFSLFYDASGPNAYEEGYVKYWMRLEDDFIERFPTERPNWRMMMEWKEPNSGTTTEKGGTNNYRINIHIVMRNGRPLWQTIGQEVQPVRITEWEETNEAHEVPVGRWFQVEAYMKKHATDGQVFFAVDGETICDYRGRTEHKDNPLPLRFWSIFKLYHGTKWIEKEPTHQWIDNVELWSGFPDRRQMTSLTSLRRGFGWQVGDK